MKHREYPALYSTWREMRKRCNSPKSPSYPYYGGRGITICERWSDFSLFVKDMGSRPAGMTLERIDNDGNYEPSNCRWASRADQMRNTRFVRLTEDSVRKIRSTTGAVSAAALAAELSVSIGTIYNVRCGIGWQDVQP